MTNTRRDPGRPPVDEPLLQKPRSLRLDDATWDGLGPDPRGTLKQLAAWYTRAPGAELPKRPDRQAAKQARS